MEPVKLVEQLNFPAIRLDQKESKLRAIGLDGYDVHWGNTPSTKKTDKFNLNIAMDFDLVG